MSGEDDAVPSKKQKLDETPNGTEEEDGLNHLAGEEEVETDQEVSFEPLLLSKAGSRCIRGENEDLSTRTLNRTK